MVAARNGQRRSAWRWRRCPSCRKVARASDFTIAQTFETGWEAGTMLRACPNCGRTGETKSFPIVRERHQ